MLLVIMGVSGSGKSTVAALLASQLSWRFEEGDELHSAANIAKMAAGVALDDDDRRPWLLACRAWLDQQAAAGESGILTCSALKRRYRDVLRGPDVVFVYLRGPQGLIEERLQSRTGHFMPAGLLGSQVDALEPPDADERSITIDTGRSPAAEVADIIGGLGLGPA